MFSRLVTAAIDRSSTHTVILDYGQRSAQKNTVTGVKGGTFEIDLAQPARLRTDDLQLLEIGGLLEVVAAAEPLIEARAADPAGLARLAWHLGDRQVPVQVLPNCIRARREAAIEALLKSLGAKVTVTEAPFEAEGGACESSHAQDYAHHAHGHGHDHHGHAHGHHHDH